MSISSKLAAKLERLHRSEGPSFKPVTRDGEGWEGFVDGWAPVQGYGRVDGKPFYFRSRTLTIGQDATLEPEDLPAEEDYLACWYVEHKVGPDDDYFASWMLHETAWEIIVEAIAQWRDGAYPLRNAPR